MLEARGRSEREALGIGCRRIAPKGIGATQFEVVLHKFAKGKIGCGLKRAEFDADYIDAVSEFDKARARETLRRYVAFAARYVAHVCALEHRRIERGVVIEGDIVPGEPVGGRVEQFLAGARPVDFGRAAGLGANCGYRVCGLVDRFCRVM